MTSGAGVVVGSAGGVVTAGAGVVAEGPLDGDVGAGGIVPEGATVAGLDALGMGEVWAGPDGTVDSAGSDATGIAGRLELAAGVLVLGATEFTGSVPSSVDSPPQAAAPSNKSNGARWCASIFIVFCFLLEPDRKTAEAHPE